MVVIRNYLAMWLFLLIANTITSVESRKILNIAVILPDDNAYPFSIDRVKPGLSIAVKAIKKLELLSDNYDLHVNYANSRCSFVYPINEAINFYVRKELDVIFGPFCDYAAAPLARQITFWSIPMLTAGAMAADFARYRLMHYPLLTRIGPNFISLTQFLSTMLREYKWNIVQLLYDPNGQGYFEDRFCHIASDSIHYGLKDEFKTPYQKFEKTEDLLTELGTVLGVNVAVVVLCANPDSVRDIMIKAEELNFNNGEYVFLNIDLFSSKNASMYPWYRANDTAESNEKARRAYESLMTVSLRKPTSPEYENFSREVISRAKNESQNFTYGEDEVNSFVGAFHDAVILYALAINETLAANESISNGTAITRRMWNRTFEGITGTVSIDENGDRSADYSLLDMDPLTGKFEVVANYFGNKKQYVPVPNRTIHWAGGRKSPPPDTPTCGYNRSKCPPDEPFPEYGIVVIVLGILLIIVMLSAFFIYSYRERTNTKFNAIPL